MKTPDCFAETLLHSAPDEEQIGGYEIIALIILELRGSYRKENKIITSGGWVARMGSNKYTLGGPSASVQLHICFWCANFFVYA